MLTFLRTVTGIEDGVIGAVMTIHTFGDYCRWNCHIHGIVADGLFYGSGMFYVMPKNVDLNNLAALFRANVFKMLKKEGKIDDSLIKNIMGWRHMSGFSVHNGVRIGRDDEDGKERVGSVHHPKSLFRGKVDLQGRYRKGVNGVRVKLKT